MDERAGLNQVVTDLATADGRGTKPQIGRERVIAVMSGAHTKGRWRCGENVTAVAVLGGCTLDFREAEISSPEVSVQAIAVMGGIRIVVPEGVAVTMHGTAIMGGRSMDVKDVPALPGSPRIVVHALPIMGGVAVQSRPPKADRQPKRMRRREPPGELATSDMPASSGTVTIMFSDICDYSGITERLGDAGAHHLLRQHNELLRAAIVRHGGREVKSNGDGFMVAFPSVGQALRCAGEFQRGLAKRNDTSDGESIRVHIGVHAGDVVEDGGDFLGNTVIVASRLADAAAPSEILVSAVGRELARGHRDFTFGSPRTLVLKGLADTRQAYPVEWRKVGADETAVV